MATTPQTPFTQSEVEEMIVDSIPQVVEFYSLEYERISREVEDATEDEIEGAYHRWLDMTKVEQMLKLDQIEIKVVVKR